VAEATRHDPVESPPRALRRRLRGRYPLALVLAVLLAALGAATGYVIVPPKYASTGTVRIDGALPTILYPTRESKVPPMFENYIAAQEMHLQSRQLLDEAVESPQMRQSGWPAGAEGVAALQRSLKVLRRRGEQIVSVTVTHRDPHRAHVAVNAVLAAYDRTRTDPGGLSLAAKEEALVEREQDLEESLRGIRGQLLEASDQYGPKAIDQMHEGKVGELMAIDQKLVEVQLSRTRLLKGHGPGIEAEARDQIAALKQQEIALMAEIRTNPRPPGHPALRRLARELETVRIQIDLYDRAHLAQDATGAAADPVALARLDELEARYEAVRHRLRAEAAELGRKRIALAGLTDHESEIRDRLAGTRRRLDELRFEARRENLNRVTITWGEPPVAPAHDRRRGLAAAGFVAGAVAGVGIVFLLGVRDPRVRYLDELEALELAIPVLAVIPDPEKGRHEAQLAADGPDQLRYVLELEGRAEATVHAIAGCDHQDGNTEIVLGLASSFAAAGRRTLVVDADLIGRRLSKSLGLAGAPGLCETLGDGDGNDRCHATHQANLWALPIGSRQAINPASLSRHALVSLLDVLRGQFDAVLVDAGAVLGGAETVHAAAVSDHVVLVVGRKQDKALVEASIARLHQLGATCAGVVFNQAAPVEVQRRHPAAPAWVGPPGASEPAVADAGHDDLGPSARLTGVGGDTEERKEVA
jgi:Mrp family chromosome partitioning ATPase/uncharacterized protein involved in exopolysaccharide biosynthesis